MTTKATILRVIRENCIDCVVGAISVIEDCGGEDSCKLYPFRFGKDPKPSRKGNLNALQQTPTHRPKNPPKNAKKEKPIGE